MVFFPYGPIPMVKTDRGLVASNKEAIRDFWVETLEWDDGLPDAVGCYIYSIRAGRGIKPWYVGMASKQSFKKECFSAHKLVHYNSAIAARKGTPVLTLVAKLTPSERWAKPSKNGNRDIQFLESMLIGACLRRNPDLLNSKDTKLLREMTVHGLLNNPKGRNYSSVTDFQSLLGL